MIKRLSDALRDGPVWVLRLVFATTAFVNGVGIVGAVVFYTYQPDSTARVSVQNGGSRQVEARWDSEEAAEIPSYGNIRFEGPWSRHVVKISPSDQRGLSLVYAFDAIEWGSDLTIEVTQIPAQEHPALP